MKETVISNSFGSILISVKINFYNQKFSERFICHKYFEIFSVAEKFRFSFLGRNLGRTRIFSVSWQLKVQILVWHQQRTNLIALLLLQHCGKISLNGEPSALGGSRIKSQTVLVRAKFFPQYPKLSLPSGTSFATYEVVMAPHSSN